jgi:succinate dehydrogenase/fumarate reductase flavoprotein subunit
VLIKEVSDMSSWHEFIQRDAPVPEWPYPVRYGQETEVETDVLVIGGGISGCHAAINARRKGVKVVVIEKGATKWSGSGGAGVDHWIAACTNPCSTITSEEHTEVVMQSTGGYDCGPLRYVSCQESWDALLDCEHMGMKIRDIDNEFKGADFRDDKTKLMFAYDYKNKINLRVYGNNVKPLLYREMRRLGVDIYDRVMVTSLLTEGGRQGSRVVGATGINVRTGEFYIIKARATVVATGLPGRIWTFSTELRTTFRDFNNVGDGCAVAWNAGAEFAKMEHSTGESGAFSYIEYAMGNTSNTWYGCPIVDARGKEVPWFDRDGKELKTVAERFQPSPGQKFILGLGERVPSAYENQTMALAPDLPDRIRKGEFVLPLYADLSRLPEHERKAIFGLMVGNEGKTRIPVYDILTKAGFDPDKDLLQAPVMPPEAYRSTNYWSGMVVPHWRIWGGGGLVVDWDLKSNLDGLYAAGGAIFGSGAHSSAAASGRYVGRRLAAYARTAPEAIADRGQVEKEKTRVYTPLKQNKHNIGWKELNAGICRIMQDHCGQYRSEETLKTGLRLLEELRESEAMMLHASTPHELGRALECHTIMTVGEIVMQASLARKASSVFLNLSRLDYPTKDPPEWQKLLPIKLSDGRVEVSELPFNYHLLPPYAPTYQENYKLHGEDI